MSSSLLLSRRDLEFMIYEWLETTALIERERFAEHTRETFTAVLDVAEKIAVEQFYPINRLLDTQEPRFDGETVHTPAELKPVLKAYVESGLLAGGFDYDVGGMQLPSVIQRAAGAWLSAASVGAGLAGLTPANASTLLKHGTAFHREVYVPRLLEGRYFGTMCLSEPQAGSSLSDITTRAEPQPDGTYRLFGNKMWISGGDEDISENIVHLVLAKIPGPDGRPIPGTRGISLFAVPKILVNDDGSHGERNDVAVAGLNHKLGFRGIPNCLLNFGEGKYPVDGRAGAVGTLVGAEHRGLACMFHMMNDARIMIGNLAAAVGYAGYLHSLEYARQRTQGRRPQNKNPEQPPIRIIEHADVRRMLLAQKAYAEGALGLNLYCARLIDWQQTARDETEAKRVELLLELLTPVAKSWPSQWCQEGNSLAIQIHGGYGYTRDFQVEQLWRDQRLNPIHEGTHGIQGLDLLGRKVRMADGAALQAFRAEVDDAVSVANEVGLQEMTEPLLASFERIDHTLGTLFGQGDLDLALANATVFLEAFGHTVLAWIWLEQATVASRAMAGAGVSDADRAYYQGKLAAARWFYAWELPKVKPMLEGLANLDRTSLDMQENWF
ncbi:MAG: acyl-CoA dehydrogenase [Burkholderiaceae bacterium]